MRRFLNKNKAYFYQIGIITLALLLCVTVYLAWHKQFEEHDQGKVRFEYLVDESQKTLFDKFKSFEYVLLSASSLFKSSQYVSRLEWQTYVDALDIRNRFQGLDGIGYITPVKEKDLKEFVKTEKIKNNAQNYVIHPVTQNKPYFIVKYIEPYQQNKESVGLNIAFEKNRRLAAELARDTANTVVTKKVLIVHDDIQNSGFLLFHPFYTTRFIPKTIEERRKQLRGWLYASFTSKKVFKNMTQSQGRDFDIEIYEGHTTNNDKLVYNSNYKKIFNSQYRVERKINIMKQAWTVVWTSTLQYEQSFSSLQPLWSILGGVGFILAFGVFLVMFLHRDRLVNSLVSEKTQQLASNEERLQLLIKHTPAAVAMFDRDLRYINASDRWLKDYSLEDIDIIGKHYYEIFPEISSMPDWITAHQNALKGQAFNKEEDSFVRADGKVEWIRWAVHPWLDINAKVGGIVVFTEFITQRKEAELLREIQKQAMENVARIIDQSLNEIYIFDSDTLKFIQVNQGACKNLGYSEQELEEKTPVHITPQFTFQEYQKLLEPVKNGNEEKVIFEAVHQRKDQSLYEVQVHTHLTRYQGKEVFLQIVLDETEQKKSERARLMLRETVADAAEATSVFSLVEKVVQKISIFLKCTIGHVFMWDDSEKILKSLPIWYIAGEAETYADFKKVTESIKVQSGIGLPGTVYAKKEALFISDVTVDKIFTRNRILENMSLHSAVGIPILVRDNVFMVLEFFYDKVVHEDKSLYEFCEMITLPISRLVERKQIEEQLETSNRLNRAVLENAPYMIIATDITGKVIIFNKQAERMLGYKASEIVDCVTPEIWHDNDEIAKSAKKLGHEYEMSIDPNFDVFIFKAMLEGTEACEWTFIRKDGSKFSALLSMSSLKSNDGKVVGFIGIAEDITNKKQQEEALRASEETFRSAMENAPIGMAIVSSKGKLLKVNKAICDLLGYVQNELIDKSLEDLSYEEDAKRDLIYAKKALDGNISNYQLEKRYYHKSGKIIWTLLSVSIVRNEDKTPKYFISQIHDITEQKEIERIKNEFISIVSHELRTPLASIKGSLGLIQGTMSNDLPTQTNHLIDIALKNSERLILLINDILDMDKIASGEMRFEMKYESLNELMEQAVEANESYVNKYGVHINLIQLESFDPIIDVDSDRFEQIISNLISNAAKFSNEGDSINIEIILKDNFVQISVEDHGPGIPADFRNKIFEKFSQADSSITRKKGGTGLGLHISKQLVTKMMGKIGFESEEGMGTTFWVEFPVVSLRKYAKHTDKGTLTKVLICEDNIESAIFMQAMLEKSGFEVTIAQTLNDASEYLLKECYSVVLLDLIFPGENSKDFIKVLEEEPSVIEPVVITSTQEPDPEIMKLSIVKSWLKKPFDELRMLEVIQHAINSNKLRVPKILYVEDNEDFSDFILNSLQEEAEFDIVSCVADAFDRIQHGTYTFMILDVEQDDGYCYEILQNIDVNSFIKIPYVILTTSDLEDLYKDIAEKALLVLSKTDIPGNEIVKELQEIIHSKKNKKEANHEKIA